MRIPGVGTTRTGITRQIVVAAIAAATTCGSAVAVEPQGFAVSGAGDADHIRLVAIHPDGTAEAFAEHFPTLYEEPSAFHALEIRRESAADVWSPAQLLAGGDSLHVLAASRTGNLIAAAWRTTATSTALDVAVRLDGTWGPVVTLPVSDDRRFADPTNSDALVGAITDSGRAAIAWSSGGTLAATVRGPAGWSPMTVLRVPGYVATRPALVINRRGDVAVAGWAQSRTAAPRIFVGGYLTSRERWSPLRLLRHRGHRASGAPGLAVRDSGAAAVAWSTRDRVWLSAGDIRTGAWGMPTIVSGSWRGVRLVTLRFDRSGRTLVAWGGALRGIAVRTRMPSGRWRPIVRVAPSGVTFAFAEFTLASNAVDGAVLATSALGVPLGGEPRSTVVVTRLSAPRNGPYRITRSIRFTQPGSNRIASQLRAALDETGRVVLGWSVFSGSNAPSTVEVRSGRL